MSRLQFGLRISAASAIFIITNHALAAQILRTVVLSGLAAPGTSPGTAFVNFGGMPTDGPVINNLGQTAFRATVSRASGIGIGIWDEQSGALEPAILRDDPSYPMLNDHGEVIFGTSAQILLSSSGSLRAVATNGFQGADSPIGKTYFSFSRPSINNRGQVIFSADLEANSDEGIWFGSPTSLKRIAHQGDPAVGVEDGSKYGYFMYSPMINNESDIAFLGNLAFTQSPDDSFAIWAGQPTALRIVARAANHAPGTSTGTVFDRLSYPILGAQGQVAFQSTLRKGSFSEKVDKGQGIWLDREGSTTLVAKSGDIAPGIAGSAVFASFNDPVVGSENETAFRGYLQTGVDGVITESSIGIWAGPTGALRLIARTRDRAPGTNGDFYFLDQSSLSMNRRGQLAFSGELEPGVGDTTQLNDKGIWAQDAAGVLRLIVRTGDELQVGPNDVRVLSGLSLLGTASRVGSGLNESGQIAFFANFADGSSGVMVSNLVAIPEPSTRLQLVAAIMVIFVVKIVRRPKTKATLFARSES